ncbi:WbuC family cupin fold metalloprotein [Patescibacteria group bacterium]|nr:WbuC family cupin fold metalloprotein [Patescibacteria group bacterium]
MDNMHIPQISSDETANYLTAAHNSLKQRMPMILHKPGANFNQVINFVLANSYMQPHQHPDKNKIEEIWLLEGDMAVLFFDDQGKITDVAKLDPQQNNHIIIPAFAWHTYVTLSDHSISYETMHGIYDPATWKEFAEWAPHEDTSESSTYLNHLKQKVVDL